MKMIALVAVCALTLIGCSDDNFTGPKASDLNTTVHRESTAWDTEFGSVGVDITWRFIAFSDNGSSINLDGGYTITFTNKTASNLGVNFSKVTFHDATGIQIDEAPASFSNIRFSLPAGQSAIKTDNFFIILRSVDVANSIVRMTPWAGFSRQ